MLRSNSKSTFRAGLKLLEKCVCVWVEKILCRVCVQILNEKLEVWSLDRAMFFSAFKNWVIILPSCTQYHTVWKQEKKCFFFFFKQMPTALWNQIKLQYKWLVWPSVIHSVCVWDSSGVTSPLRTKTTSPAGSPPQVLLEIKQEISALWNKHTQVSHIFWLPVCCQQLNPITTLLFCVFWLLVCTFSP